MTFELHGVVLPLRLIGGEMMPVCVCVRFWACVCLSGSGAMAVYLCLTLSARCMALLWSFYPRQILGNVGNFSQTLLVTVPRQLLLTNTHKHTDTLSHLLPPPLTPTSLTDTAQRADTWLCMLTQTHTLGNCGVRRDQQKHSGNRRRQKEPDA